MDFSSSYFGKPLRDLSFQDIQSFFLTEQIESTRIEFKSFPKGVFKDNIDNVLKGICALLNSEGGILICGAPIGEDKQNEQGQKIKMFKGSLTLIKDDLDKDWVINKISGLLTPLPIGIQFLKLESPGASGWVYLLEVQQSNYAPHSFNNIYYARLDGQTKPAPHYLIEALFKKIKYPNLEGYIKFEKLEVVKGGYKLDIAIIIINFSELQNEENLFFSLLISTGNYLQYRLGVESKNYPSNAQGKLRIHQNYEPIVFFGQPIRISECIYLPSSELVQMSHILNLLLVFGGKSSPLKSSSYKLHISSPTLGENQNNLIIDKQENILFSEKQSELGSTRESILLNLLGRNV